MATWYRVESARPWSLTTNNKRFAWAMFQAEARDGFAPRVVVDGRQVWPK